MGDGSVGMSACCASTRTQVHIPGPRVKSHVCVCNANTVEGSDRRIAGCLWIRYSDRSCLRDINQRVREQDTGILL